MAWALSVAVLAGSAAGWVMAGDDRHHDREEHGEKHHRDGHGEGREHGLGAVDNAAYRETCGACHFAYPAGLLPAGSWRLLLAGTGDHFGNALDLAPAIRQEVAAYLETGAADRSGGEESDKLLRGLGRNLPLRVTELPGFRREHRKLAPEVAARPSIGSLANCPACHRTAESGDFDDDNVSIPRQ
jgi:hypothetical protein